MPALGATLYGGMLDAVVERVGADAGSIQLLDAERPERLRLIAWRGFDPVSAYFWQVVRAGALSTCGAALAAAERIVVEDVEGVPEFAGGDDLREWRRSRVRAVQSTPVLGRDGAVLGMLSTHWRRPHTPLADELRVVDELVQELVRAAPLPAAPSPDAAETALRQYASGIVNRRIATHVGTLDSAFLGITGERGSATFLCACGRETCRHTTLTVSLAVYDRVRESPHRFLVLPGHAVAGIDRVVERGDGYEIVELRPEHRHPTPPTADGGPQAR